MYAYACLYAVLKKIPINALTVSFVGYYYPGKLLKHLRETYGYTVEKKAPGIYIVHGDKFPIQIINQDKLSPEENLWLKSLNNRLNATEFKTVAKTARRLGKAARIAAYVDVISRANIKAIKEVIKMEKLTFEKVLEDAGFIAKWEARGEARGIAKGEARGIVKGEARGIAKGEARGEKRKALIIAQNLVNMGVSYKTVVSATSLDPKKVKEMYAKSKTTNIK